MSYERNDLTIPVHIRRYDGFEMMSTLGEYLHNHKPKGWRLVGVVPRLIEMSPDEVRREDEVVKEIQLKETNDG